jgi:hypothetical protein
VQPSSESVVLLCSSIYLESSTNFKWKILEVNNSQVLNSIYYSMLFQLFYYIIIANLLPWLINKLNCITILNV